MEQILLKLQKSSDTHLMQFWKGCAIGKESKNAPFPLIYHNIQWTETFPSHITVISNKESTMDEILKYYGE